MFLTNAFSINMIDSSKNLNFLKVDHQQAKQISRYCMSAIGHADTATAVSILLEGDFPQNRQTVRFENNLLVAQYKGDRLEEGTTVLPEGATLEFWLVTDSKNLSDALQVEHQKWLDYVGD